MLKVGLTGGIGSGKSTVAHIFETLGIPVYYADDAAKKLMNEDEGLKQQVQQLLGEGAYSNGQLNRAFVSAQVFNNADKLAMLNAIVHPATITDAAKWMKQQSAPYAIKESALIFESGAQENLDKLIGVFAPKAIRIKRVMDRDGITREGVLARMNKQINETIKMRLCSYVITNDEQQMLIPQVLNVHKELLTLQQTGKSLI